MKTALWAILFIAAVIYLSLVYIWVQEGNRHFNCQDYYRTLESNDASL